MSRTIIYQHLFVCLMLGLGNLFLQPAWANIQQQSDEFVKFTITYPDTIWVGDTLSVEIGVVIESGWHLYSPKPINRQIGREPLTLEFVNLPKGIVPLGSINYSEGLTLEGGEIYLGTNNRLTQRFAINGDHTGKALLECRITFQGCNADVCMPPTSVTVSKNLKAAGPSGKRSIQPEDYRLWEKLHFPEISPDGHFISYRKENALRQSTWYLTDVRNGHTVPYSTTEAGKFLKYHNRFAYRRMDTLVVQTAEGTILKEFPGLRRYSALQDGRVLMTCAVDFFADTLKTFTLVDTRNWNEQTIRNVKTFSVSPEEERIAFFVEESGQLRLTILEVGSGISKDLILSRPIVKNTINWSDDGRGLAFLLESKKLLVTTPDVGCILDVDDLTLIDLQLEGMPGWSGMKMARSPRRSLKLSADKRFLFLEVEQVSSNPQITSDSDVEIWQQRSKMIFPYQNSIFDHRNRGKMAKIEIASRSLVQLQGREEAVFTVSADDRFAIVLDYSPYEPTYLHQGEYADVYFLDIEKNTKKLVVSKLQMVGSRPMFTQKLKGMVYQRGGDLIFYQWETGAERILNQKMTHPITKFRSGVGGIAVSSDGNSFYLFDEFDLWKVSLDGALAECLTDGREAGITYTFSDHVYHEEKKGGEILVVDERNGFYLQMEDLNSRQAGFAKWSPRSGVQQIVFGQRKYRVLSVLPRNGGYIYLQEKFDEPPSFVWQHADRDVRKVLVQSNAHQSNFHWGRSEMIYYHTTPVYTQFIGRKQNAALFYPANYQPGKKYPMIVSIYDNNTYMLHEYQNPGPSSYIDFNPTDYTLDGYFVLQPNLSPRDPANPGHSMLENLLAAVEHVKSTGMVDADRIGLYGHSFGGYEALFAATQTNVFATVVAGAAITDLVTDYFSHRVDLRGPSFYRTDWMQHAMKRNYFEIPELFHANSPFHHLDKIQSPVLLWTGKADGNVGWEQSVQFYLGMLRLQKECTLLVYPGEGHVLFNPKNLKDLDDRMKRWFDHYLKGGARQAWMEIPTR